MDKAKSVPVNIQLNRVNDTSGGLVWEMDVAGIGKGGPGNYPKIGVPKDQSGTVFKFTIAGQNTQNVKFMPTTTSPTPTNPGPICVAPDTNNGASPSCPSSNGQIIDISAPGKTLTFTNTNTTPGDLVYQLNFIGAPPLDPVIQNGGGGVPPRPDFDSVAYLLGGALLLLLAAAFLWKRSRNNQRDVNV